MHGPNAAQRERWNGPSARHWIDHEASYDRELLPFGAALVHAAGARDDDRGLDVGCGTGTTALAVAASARSVVGVDISAPLISRAQARAQKAGCVNTQFVVGDAQLVTFDATFDLLVSRFGLMFFDDPVGAFTNLLRAMRPGGRLVTVCWRGLERNDWMRVPGEALARVMPVGDLAEPGQPGPFALSDHERLRSILRSAGWTDVALETVDAPVVLGGASLDEAVEFERGTALVRSVLADATPDMTRRALDAVRDALAPYEADGRVALPGSAWLVRAAA